MGLIGIIKPQSTVLSSAINKSKQHLEKNYWECRESNLGLLGEKQVCYLCAMQPPSLSLSEVGVVIFGVGGVVVVVFCVGVVAFGVNFFVIFSFKGDGKKFLMLIFSFFSRSRAASFSAAWGARKNGRKVDLLF